MIGVALFSVSLSAALIPVADGPPHFDVAATCRYSGSLAAGIRDTPQGCENDERRARAALEERWANFPAPRRDGCVADARLVGSPSYVQVLTCLEMGAPK